MMISSLLAISLSLSAQQVNDSATQARNAFTGCLNTHMREALDRNDSPEAFDQSLAAACAAERATYRDAVIDRERSFGDSRADAEEYANIEIEDAQSNASALFRVHKDGGTAPE